MKSEDMQLARAYVRIQPYSKPMTPQEGMEKGTIFADLYMPYSPSGRKRETESTRIYKGGTRIEK